MAREVVGIQRHLRAEFRYCLLIAGGLVCPEIRKSELEVCALDLRIEFHCLVELSHRFVGISGLAVGSSDENVIEGGVAPLLEHGIENGAGSLFIVKEQVRLAEQICDGKLRIFGEGDLELFSGTSVVAQLKEDLSQQEIGLRILGIEAHGFLGL